MRRQLLYLMLLDFFERNALVLCLESQIVIIVRL